MDEAWFPAVSMLHVDDHTLAERPGERTPEADPRRYRTLAPRAPLGPVDLTTLLRGDGPIEVDVGFGRGRSVLMRAAEAPSVRLLGLEVKHKWVHRVHEALTKEGHDTVRVFAEDARSFLARAEPSESVSRVSFHFPDPWWKKRHAKRSVLTPVVARHVARLLAPAGVLLIQTDVADRAQAYHQLLANMEAFHVEAGVANAAGPRGWPKAPMSNREIRARKDGLTIYRLVAKKRGLR